MLVADFVMMLAASLSLAVPQSPPNGATSRQPQDRLNQQAGSRQARPVPDAEILSEAQTAFQQGMDARGRREAAAYFRKASALYEELRQRGAHNPALYLNQGNASLLAGDLPQAILAYRRGLDLAPNQRDLRANLAYARDRVVYSSTGSFGRPPVDYWPPWLPRLTPKTRLLSAFLLYGLACVALTRWWMTRRSGLLVAGAMGLALAGLCAIGWALAAWNYRHDHGPRGLVVIAADDVLVRRGNGFSYSPRYDIPLNRGVEACLRFARANWVQIELSGGKVGWVPRSAVLVDDSSAISSQRTAISMEPAG